MKFFKIILYVDPIISVDTFKKTHEEQTQEIKQNQRDQRVYLQGIPLQ